MRILILMATRTVYVSDEDEQAWRAFQQYAQDHSTSTSLLLARVIRRFLAEVGAKTEGTESPE